MKKVFGLVSLLLVVAGLVYAFTNGHEPKPTASENTAEPTGTRSVSNTEGLQVGDIAPDFMLKNVDDNLVSLADIKNEDGSVVKGYIVTFTCNTCPYAVMYEDRLIELHQKYASKGWPVVAINPNDPEMKPGDSFSEMKVRAKEKNFAFAYLFDDGQKVYPAYGATKTPHVYLLDNTRKVRYIGAIDNNPQDADAASKHYVEDAIMAIEAGKEPEPNFTKAIGCGIKAKS